MNETEKIEAITDHMKAIMNILGVEETPSTEGTPRRVAKMYVKEIFKNINNNNLDDLKSRMAFFPNHNKDNDELIIVKDIPFYSTCEHHFMPFSGKITIGYVPSDTLVGLSKLPRVVKFFSKKPQLQENLVMEIANFLYEELGEPQALFVIARDCIHTCVSARGIETYCETDTLVSLGNCKNEHYGKFFSRIGGN